MSEVRIVMDHLAAWRDDSRRPPRTLARQQARAAMHSTLVSGATAAPAWHSTFRFRLRRRPLLTGAAAILAAAVAVVALGWNAPAGSALFGIRAARQVVQLVLPGADAASLHLQFAEQDLADASVGTDAAPSLADARSQLRSALTALNSDRGSPLWVRYEDDQTTLSNEERGIGASNPGQPAGTGVGVLPGTTSPASSPGSPAPGTSPKSSASPRPTGSGDDGSPAPSRSGSGGDDSGGDDGGGHDGGDDGGGGGGDS